MNQSLKAILQLIVLVALIVSFCAWAMPKHPDEVVWGLRFGAPALAGSIIWLLVRVERRVDKAPDLLRERIGIYFERDGLCFGPQFEVESGQCRLSLYFQNRYARPCNGRIVIKPGVPSFRIMRMKLPSVVFDVHCGPGGFGVARIFYPVPQKYQGKKVNLEVGANVKYPQGRGQMVRFRDGLRTGPANFGGVGDGMITAGLLLVGVVHIGKAAWWKGVLPRNVSETAPSSDIEIETLWEMDLPTGGFPVIAPSADVERAE